MPVGCGEEINETFRTGQRGFLTAWSTCEAALGWPLVCCGWDGFGHSDGLWWLMVGVRMGDDVSTNGWWCGCCPSETRLSEGWCGIFLIIFFSLSVCVRSRDVSQSTSLGAQVVLAFRCLFHRGHSCWDIVFGQEGAMLSSLWWYRCTATCRLVSEVKHQFWGRPAKPSETSDTFWVWIAV